MKKIIIIEISLILIALGVYLYWGYADGSLMQSSFRTLFSFDHQETKSFTELFHEKGRKNIVAIDECTGKTTYYILSSNAYDGNGEFIDAMGKPIYEGCGWQNPKLCPHTKPGDCRKVYVTTPNIYGFPEVDIYGVK